MIEYRSMPVVGTDHYVFPGKFNPLHRGHLAIAHYVKDKFNKEIDFEIAVRNITKNQAGKIVVDGNLYRIVKQFLTIHRNLIITNDLSFVAKSSTFVGKTFCVGADVFYRITDTVNYFQSVKETLRCIDIIRNNGCRFLVFPRTEEQAICGIRIPKFIQDITEYAEGFNIVNISSSEIRKRLAENNK